MFILVLLIEIENSTPLVKVKSLNLVKFRIFRIFLFDKLPVRILLDVLFHVFRFSKAPLIP